MPRRSAKNDSLRRQPSQRAIGELAGVSQATVSLVLAGHTVSSEETRRRVLDAAEKLRYRPNLLVEGIKTGRTKMIGVMAPPYDYFWSGILYGIHDVLCANDHVPITLWTSHSAPHPGAESPVLIREIEQIHRLLDRRVDGVIMWPPFASSFEHHIEEFRARDTPVVTIDHVLPARFSAAAVMSDEAMGGRLVAEHLLSLGHRRIAHFAGHAWATWAKQRRAAFEATLMKAGGIDYVVEETPEGTATSPAEAVRAILSRKPRPTAVFAASDPMAKVVYRVAAAMKLRIPQDLSVVGYADDDFTTDMTPPLTTVRQPAYPIGAKAAELVLERAGGDAVPRLPRVEVMPVSLIVRESTARAGTA